MGIFSKFKRGLKKGAQSIQGAFASVTGRGKLDEDSLLQIEEAFYESDFGVETRRRYWMRFGRLIERKKNFVAKMPVCWPGPS